MERATTTVDPFAIWSQAQQDFWDRWRMAMANDAKPAVPALGMLSLPIEFWKATIYGTIEVQLAAAEMWKNWICANDANIPEITQGACQLVHFAEDWTRAQMRLWDSWFAALDAMAPGATAQPAAESSAAKPRAHGAARRHATPPREQTHNGVPA